MLLRVLRYLYGVCYMSPFWKYRLANLGLFSLICFVTSFSHLCLLVASVQRELRACSASREGEAQAPSCPDQAAPGCPNR